MVCYTKKKYKSFSLKRLLLVILLSTKPPVLSRLLLYCRILFEGYTTPLENIKRYVFIFELKKKAFDSKLLRPLNIYYWNQLHVLIIIISNVIFSKQHIFFNYRTSFLRKRL